MKTTLQTLEGSTTTTAPLKAGFDMSSPRSTVHDPAVPIPAVMDEDGDDEDMDDEEMDQITYEWDEGGPSQCGYHESVHDTLMTVGKSVHGVVGDPSDDVEQHIHHIGQWFQEASYAVRDFMRGKHKDIEDDAMETASTMQRDTIVAVNSMMGGNGGNGSVTSGQEAREP